MMSPETAQYAGTGGKGMSVAAKVKERGQGIFSTFLIDGAPELQGDERWLRAMIEELHR